MIIESFMYIFQGNGKKVLDNYYKKYQERGGLPGTGPKPAGKEVSAAGEEPGSRPLMKHEVIRMRNSGFCSGRRASPLG